MSPTHGDCCHQACPPSSLARPFRRWFIGSIPTPLRRAPSSNLLSLPAMGPRSCLLLSELLVTAGPCLRIIFRSREPGSSTHTEWFEGFSPLPFSLFLSPRISPYLRFRPALSFARARPLRVFILPPVPLVFPFFLLPLLPDDERATRVAGEERTSFSIRLDCDTRSRYFPASARQP